VDKPWWVFERPGKRFVFAWAPEPGVRRQRALPNHLRTKAGAEKYARAHLEELMTVRAIRARHGVPLLKTIAEKWIPLRKADATLSPSTRANNVSQLKTHILPALGEMPVDQIDVPCLRNFSRELAKKLAPYTCRNVMSTLAELFDAAMGEGWIETMANPATARAVRKVMPEPRPLAGRSQKLRLSLEQAQALLDCEAIPLERRVRYALGCTSGMRDGEIAGLTWADVDLDPSAAVARIRKAVQLVGPEGHATIGKTKTEDSERDQPLHAAALAALAEWQGGGWEAFVGKAPATSSPLFANDKGTWWRPRSARLFREDLERAGLPTSVDGHALTFHALRRTFASALEKLDVPKDKADRLMGHCPKGAGDRHYTDKDFAILAGHVARIEIRWGRVQTPADPPCGGPMAQCEPMPSDAIAGESQYDSDGPQSSAHAGYDFLNRRSAVRSGPGAPQDPSVPHAPCAADKRVRTRSCTRDAEPHESATESGDRSRSLTPQHPPLARCDEGLAVLTRRLASGSEGGGA